MHSPLRLRSLPTSFATAALLVAGTFFAAAPASAGPPSPREVHRQVRGHLLDVLGGIHDLARVLDPIPLFLEVATRGDLEVYFDGQEYYGPHRHYHDVYSFPVLVDGVVVYRPHVYCDARLFSGVGGYYPRNNIYYRSDEFRSHRGYDRDHHWDHRWDRGRRESDRDRSRDRYRDDSRDRYRDDSRDHYRDDSRSRSRDGSRDRRSGAHDESGRGRHHRDRH